MVHQKNRTQQRGLRGLLSTRFTVLLIGDCFAAVFTLMISILLDYTSILCATCDFSMIYSCHSQTQSKIPPWIPAMRTCIVWSKGQENYTWFIGFPFNFPPFWVFLGPVSSSLAADFQKLLLKRRALENIVSMAEKTDAAREAVFSYGSECQVSRTWGNIQRIIPSWKIWKAKTKKPRTVGTQISNPQFADSISVFEDYTIYTWNILNYFSIHLYSVC